MQELGHPTALVLGNCRFSCGRQNLLEHFKHIRQDNDKPHTTLILYGPPGCGMCKLSEQVQTAVGQGSVVTIAGNIPAQFCPSQPAEAHLFTNLFSI